MEKLNAELVKDLQSRVDWLLDTATKVRRRTEENFSFNKDLVEKSVKLYEAAQKFQYQVYEKTAQHRTDK